LSIDRKWLKNRREKMGFTQEKLAKQVGVTRQHIGMLENGDANPSPYLAKKIASALGFDWTKFYEEQ